jgi:subtilisin family serine protease
MSRRLCLLALAVAAAVAAGIARSLPAHPARGAPGSEVVVRLTGPPLARGGRAAVLDRVQARFASALRVQVPSARIRWRYRLVLNAVAVVLPPGGDSARLRALPGVADVYPSATYSAAAGPAVGQIGAPQLWTSGLPTTGDGIKIGIIDDGVDQAHPFFNPAGYTMPPGFPKGMKSFTTAKVIVARVFPAPGQTERGDLIPFEQDESHGTHVAGIAAGNAGTNANGAILSGVAPRAYLGNYRALTVPTDGGFGDDGNAPELVAAIEAAVADGMNVINLSVGQPEIEPSRDVVAIALDGAAAAGVVPVASAGNDFEEFGAGSVSSPATASRAIAVAAVSAVRAGGVPNVVGYFSSEGPTPLSLRLKPEVSAPGVSIFSSLPGGWGSLSGTSMAAPHVSGGVALLRERHPDWTVEQIKSALVETGSDVWLDRKHTRVASPMRGGGGLIDLPQADAPLVFAEPSTISFGLMPAGESRTATVTLADAGGGAGPWAVHVQTSKAHTARVTVPVTVQVPGTLNVSVTSAATVKDADTEGYVVLQLGTTIRRLPFWVRVTHARLASDPATRLAGPGVYRGDTGGRRNLVAVYRYPERAGVDTTPRLAGPEQRFRFALRRPAQNLGVVVLSRGRGVTVQPRVLGGDDENRLTGYAALPVVLNPYLAGYGRAVLAAGALRPAPGTYDIVFDSRTAAGAGPYRFRLWVNDVSPPSVRLRTRSVAGGQPVRVAARDTGSGVDPDTAVARIDGTTRKLTYREDGDEFLIDTAALAPGRHRLMFQVSDYQETRNTENVAAVLPNTSHLAASIVVRS